MRPTITAAGTVIVAGFAAPGLGASAESSRSELVRYLRERILEREGPGTGVHTVYVPDQRGAENVVVGVPRQESAQVPVGDVYVRLAPATYAVFGTDSTVPDPVDELWTTADAAELAGEFERVLGACFEIDRGAAGVELWLPIRLR